VPAGLCATGRLRRAVAVAVGDAARSVAEVADSFGVKWPSAHQAFVEHARPRLVELEPTSVLGIDETRRGKPRWVTDLAGGGWKRLDPYDTGFVDLAGPQGLLGQVTGRTSKCVVGWLQARTSEFRQAVAFVAIDPAACHAAAIRTPGCGQTRRSWSTTSTSSNPPTTPLPRCGGGSPGIKRATAAARPTRHRRTASGCSKPGNACRRRVSRRCGTRSSTPARPTRSSRPGSAEEELRGLLALARTDATRSDIDRKLFAFYTWCANTDIDELHTLATTVETWWPAIEALIATGITNAKTEGINRLVRQVKRSACGFPVDHQPAPPSTVPLHPDPPGDNSNFTTTARSKLRSRIVFRIGARDHLLQAAPRVAENHADPTSRRCRRISGPDLSRGIQQ
jgi:hypothetical protein